MQLQKLKEYIVINNCIESILEKVGCHSFTERLRKDGTTELRCARPEHNNPTAISVNKETLFTKMYSSEGDLKGDIFSLIMDIKNINFFSSLKLVHSILGIDFKPDVIESEQEPISVALELFKRAEKTARAKQKDVELKFYDESILKNYTIAPVIWFFREDILPDTQDKFKIGYCHERSRVVMPVKYWQGDENQYIGVFGRTILDNYEELGISKYLPLIEYPKTLNLYGLHENFKDIQRCGSVVVFESEKSVLKADTMKHFNTVAVGSHELSVEHTSILMSLGVEIVIAYDKDISESFMIDTCAKFRGVRPVSYICDTEGLLGSHDSPVDRGIVTYEKLLAQRKYVYLTNKPYNIKI
jgi:DNA primase